MHATGLLDTGADAAFDRIARLASRLLATPFGFVTVVDDTRSFWKAAIGIDATDPAERQNRVEESFCQYVIGTEEAFLIDDARVDPRTADNPSIESMGVRAWAGVPLRASSGEVLGTVCVVDTAIRTWQTADAELLAELAAIAADEIAALATAAMARRAEALLAAILERAPIGFCLVDDQLRFEMVNDVLAAFNGRSVAEHMGRPVYEVLNDDGGPIIDAMRAVASGASPSVHIDFEGEAPDRPGIRRSFAASYFSVEVTSQPRRVAALVTDETERLRAQERATALASIARRLADATTVDEVAAVVHETAPGYLGADLVGLGLIDSATGRIDVVCGAETLASQPHETAHRDMHTPFGQAIRTGRRVELRTRAEHREAFSSTVEATAAAGIEGTVVAPLAATGRQSIGVMSCGWRRPLTDADIPGPQLETLVDVVAQAIGRVRATADRTGLIDSLHRMVLLTPPAGTPIDVAVRYLPATQTLGFGGDWYDVVVLDEHRCALIVGDIVGHDPTAAARMTQVRAVLGTLLRMDVSLASLFDRTTAMLATDDHVLATVSVTVVDARKRTLTTISAGHPPPLLRNPAGSVTHVEQGQRPWLGVDGPEPTVAAIPYTPGSLLVSYTDGLVETRRGSIDDDIERLGAVLASIDTTDPELAATLVLETCAEPDKLSDDIALVVARL